MNMRQAIDALTRHKDLTQAQMHSVMQLIMTGEATHAQIAAFLVSLRMKGETVTEITAAAEVMRQLATPVTINAASLVDIVGTGGDDANLFNVSSCSSFVVAAAGAKVAKHGNRSVSSSSGSSDLLEAAGLNLNLSPQQVAQCVEELGVGFMFAPAHHSALKHAVSVRAEMGVRTLFNILGPLTNPAKASHQLLGVYKAELLEPLAQVLANLGLTHAVVVHGEEGLDEVSIAGPTQVVDYQAGKFTRYVIRPEDFGLPSHSLAGLTVSSAEESFTLVKQVLNNEAGAALDMVVLNSGVALYAADVAATIQEGVTLAQEAIASGKALAKLEALKTLTQSFN